MLFVGFVEYPVGIGRTDITGECPHVAAFDRIVERSGNDIAFRIASDRCDIGNEQHGDARGPSIEFRRTNGRILDPDQTVFKRFARFVACVDRPCKALIHIVIGQFAQRFPIAFPESFENHGIRALGPFEEAKQIEALVRRSDGANAGFVSGRAIVTRTQDHRLPYSLQCIVRLRRCLTTFETARHDFFLVLRTTPEHRIEAQPQKGCDHGKDDDLGDHLNNLLPDLICRGAIRPDSPICVLP